VTGLVGQTTAWAALLDGHPVRGAALLHGHPGVHWAEALVVGHHAMQGASALRGRNPVRVTQTSSALYPDTEQDRSVNICVSCVTW